MSFLTVTKVIQIFISIHAHIIYSDM